MNRVLWPFPVNWRVPFEVTHSFRTDIFTSNSGVEQRRAIRPTPRKIVRFAATFGEEKLRRFNRLMATAHNMELIIPEVTRRVEIAAYNAGTDTASLATARPNWLNVGGEVIVNGRVGEIAAVAADSFTLLDPIGVAVPTGSFAYHALTGRLPSRMNAARLTNTLVDTQITFNVTPGSEIISAIPPGALFEGREIMVYRHNWRSGQGVDQDWPVSTLDYDAGVIAVRSPIDFPSQERDLDLLIRSPEEAEIVLGFFQRMRGRRGEFVRQTGERDLIADAQVIEDEDTLLVDGTDTYETFLDDPVHSAIAVEIDGQTYYRRITGLALVAGNTEITVDEPWPVTGVVRRASWLYLSRLVSDDLTISWATDSVAVAALTSRSLPWLGAVDYTALRATPAGEDRETPEGEQRMVLYV